jgi:hypothetical protein
LVLLLVSVWASPAFAQYTTRYTAIANGAVTFTGNALGLDSEPNQNGQGTSGSIGTFITTNTGSRDITPLPTTAPQFPFGTTNDWRQNGSQAVLRLPAGARVLHAELIWGGTFAGDVTSVGTPLPLVVERSTYQTRLGSVWAAGTNVAGTPVP